jgi:methyl-accepting chemotaxis protein
MGRAGLDVRRAMRQASSWAGLAVAAATALGALVGLPGPAVAAGTALGAALLFAAERFSRAETEAYAALLAGEVPASDPAVGADPSVHTYAQIRRSHREALGDLRHDLGEILGLARGVHSRGEALSLGTDAQTFSIDETVTSILEISRSIQSMVDMVEKLFPSTEAASSSVLSMIQGIRLIGDSSKGLLGLVDDVSTAIGRQAEAADEVRQSASALAESSRASSKTMTQIATSISEVARHAAEAARAASAVAADADRGRAAAARASGAVTAMRDTVRDAASTLAKLGERSREIGVITTTIEQITDRTNLLALNASIIAAQAGEHGKGFAVVAGEIKRLAEQTARSTVEIGALIRSIQAEVEEALRANQGGGAAAEEGVRLADEAARALDQILESARRASGAAEEIARAASDQAAGSDAIIRTTREELARVESIATAIDRHARETQEVQASARRMLELTREVTRVNQEQQQATASITAVIQEVKSMVESMFGITRQQRQGSNQIIQATEIIKYISSENVRGIGDLFGAVRELKDRIERFESGFGGRE